jgi:hypothetical protein
LAVAGIFEARINRGHMERWKFAYLKMSLSRFITHCWS